MPHRAFSFSLLLTLGLSLAAVAPAVAEEEATWPCRPASVALPQGFDPERIYLASRPSLLPDGKRFLFEWCNAIWIAPLVAEIITLILAILLNKTTPLIYK